MPQPSVLHVYKDYFPPVVGGIENHINLLCEGLQDEYKTRVLVANPGGRRTKHETVGGVEVVRCAEFGRPGGTPLCPSFPRWLKRMESEILHFQYPHPTGDLACFLARPKARVVVTFQCDIVRQARLRWLYAPLMQWFLRRADAILPTSPPLIRSSPALRGFADKCIAIPMGVPLERYEKTPEIEEKVRAIRAKHERPIILFVGKLRYYKGLDILLQAMRDLEADLLIVGEGREGPKLVQQVARLAVDEQVRFVGEQTGDDLVAHYHAADVFCLPSHMRAEAFSLAQVEAMACGLPLVSCSVGTGVEWVNMNDITGFVVEPGRPEKLSGALRQILTQPKLRKRLSENCRQRARAEFDSKLMIERVKAVYRWVLNRNGPPPRFVE